jgi:hypothetical protein
MVEDIAGVDGTAPIGHGAVETGAEGLRVKASGGGLRPPLPNSVEPSGTPTRATGPDEAIPVGDEAEAAGRAKAPPAEGQVPDAVPATPPPSKVDMPVLDTPVPESVPVPEHESSRLGASGVAPDVSGLTPGDASSVAPIGMPVWATGAPGPIPSGEVASIAGTASVPPICAKTALQPKNVVSIAAISTRLITRSLDRPNVQPALRPQAVACSRPRWRPAVSLLV